MGDLKKKHSKKDIENHFNNTYINQFNKTQESVIPMYSEFFFTDKNNTRSILWFYTGSTSSNLTLQQDTDWTPPFFFDSNQTFTYEATGTFTNCTLSIYMIRVR